MPQRKKTPGATKRRQAAAFAGLARSRAVERARIRLNLLRTAEDRMIRFPRIPVPARAVDTTHHDQPIDDSAAGRRMNYGWATLDPDAADE